MENIFSSMKIKYSSQPINEVDGMKIEFENEWVHLRKSNTEPIIRIYSESGSTASAEALAQKIMKDIRDITAL